MWVWSLFFLFPLSALGSIGRRDAGWAIWRWPKIVTPESQVSKVTGDCNAFFKKPSWSTQVQTSEVLKGTFPEVFLLQRKGWGRFVPRKIYFKILPPPDPIPPIFFYPLAGFEKFPVIVITSTEEMILLQSLLAKKVMDPSNFRDLRDGRGWWLPESGFNSRVVLSYPGNGG